jgi:hypothetical protein
MPGQHAKRVPLYIVCEIADHSDIEVTMTIYAHTWLDEKQPALRGLAYTLD